jgi:hypothetical protein
VRLHGAHEEDYGSLIQHDVYLEAAVGTGLDKVIWVGIYVFMF